MLKMKFRTASRGLCGLKRGQLEIATGSGGSGSGEAGKPPILATTTKLSFAKGTKKENAEEGAEGMVV